jgi:hypothetical protein
MNWLKEKIESNTSKVIAALFGTLICTIALTIGITLIWPFGDTVEHIFAGGTFFFIFWAGLFYWTILAEKGSNAWLRIFSILIPVAILDITMLLKPFS